MNDTIVILFIFFRVLLIPTFSLPIDVRAGPYQQASMPISLEGRSVMAEQPSCKVSGYAKPN